MIELYHGSNVGIATIDLCKCSPNKDFGRGFYLIDIREQAVQMAQRRTRIAGWGTPWCRLSLLMRPCCAAADLT